MTTRWLTGFAALLLACSGGTENASQQCKAATDCYRSIDSKSLRGEVQCLDKVVGGYCTHLCVSDADCCAVAGECKTNTKQVCAPFESTGLMMCFLSCEAADVGTVDTTKYCQSNASTSFTCRSTGGGGLNRKVCSP